MKRRSKRYIRYFVAHFDHARKFGEVIKFAYLRSWLVSF